MADQTDAEHALSLSDEQTEETLDWLSGAKPQVCSLTDDPDCEACQ